jgi:hypothetical protein
LEAPVVKKLLSIIAVPVLLALGFAVPLLAINDGSAATAAGTYLTPPHNGGGVTLQWYWQIGGGTLPSMTSGSASTANIWDTDLFNDSNTSGIPTGPSSIVTALHAANKYSICYVEAGAFQTGFPDNADFAPADYGNGASSHVLQGYPNEWYFDLRGFAAYNGTASSLTGAAPDIAAGLAKRFGWCKLEGQDAVEADDLDAYSNGGGGWPDTQADAVGFEHWIADAVHAAGLAWFDKNDPPNAAAAVADGADGYIIEECNHYSDPCSGSGGDATPFLAAGLPVLNAEYTQDGESTASFCPADIAAGITGALFDVNLAGGTYQPCTTGSGYTYPTGGSSSTSTTTPSTSTTSPTTTSTTPTTTTETTTTTTTTSTSTTTTTTPPPPPKPKCKRGQQRRHGKCVRVTGRRA